jgi:hypothetical protein
LLDKQSNDLTAANLFKFIDCIDSSMKSILGILGIIAGTMLIATLLQNAAYAETDLSNFQNEMQKEYADQANHAQSALAQLNLAFQFQINNQQAINVGTCVVSTC